MSGTGGKSGGKSRQGLSKKEKKSGSKRAGIVFPVGRVKSMLRKGHYAPRIGAGASVYLTAVLEYIVAEILELAGNAARDNKRVRIIPRYINLAIRSDEELSQLFSKITISSSGVVPFIHQTLIPQRTKKPQDNQQTPSSPKAKSPKAKSPK